MAGRTSYRGGAGRTALVGLLTGLSLICLYLAFLAPSGKLGVVALAGIWCISLFFRDNDLVDR